ncbi:MAG: hypothetical protein LBF27_19905 [Sphingobacterium sp.]|jgi:hypothetical protein|nr:hypothetical protein [Sphingobacterium sp.]
MKKTKNKFSIFKTASIVTFVVTVFALFSCSKNSSDTVNPIDDSFRKLKKIEIDAKNSIELKYANEALTEILDITDGALSSTKINYNTDKKPQEVFLPEGKVKFIYTTDKLVKEEFYSPNSQTVAASNLYHYDGNKPIEIISYDEQDEPFLRRMLFYNVNGDVDRMELYGPGDNDTFKLMMKVKYAYDDKINPFLYSIGNYLSLFNQIYSKHNIVVETTEDYQGVVSEVVTTSYTYDQNGYPLTASEKTVKPHKDAEIVNKKFIYLP